MSERNLHQRRSQFCYDVVLPERRYIKTVIFFAIQILREINFLGYKGGETTFYDITAKGDKETLKVKPSTGMVLLHDHIVYHGVPELVKGTKYVIRTDVMYRSA